MKLGRNEMRVLGTIATVSYFTGAVLFLLSNWLRVATPIGEQHSPAEHWVRAFHTTITYSATLAVGYLIKGHVLPGLRIRRRIWSGGVNLGVVVTLTVSALMIFYAGESDWNSYATQVHAIVGLMCPIFLLFHAVFRYKSRRNVR